MLTASTPGCYGLDHFRRGTLSAYSKVSHPVAARAVLEKVSFGDRRALASPPPMEIPQVAAPGAAELGNTEPLNQLITQRTTSPQERLRHRYPNAGVGQGLALEMVPQPEEESHHRSYEGGVAIRYKVAAYSRTYHRSPSLFGSRGGADMCAAPLWGWPLHSQLVVLPTTFTPSFRQAQMDWVNIISSFFPR